MPVITIIIVMATLLFSFSCGKPSEQKIQANEYAAIPAEMSPTTSLRGSMKVMVHSIDSFRETSSDSCYQRLLRACIDRGIEAKIEPYDAHHPKLGSQCKRAGLSSDWIGGPGLICYYQNANETNIQMVSPVRILGKS